MKKLITYAFIGTFLTTMLISCGSSGAHCEAYDRGYVSMDHIDIPDVPDAK